jgi:hypothetical protein
MARLVVQPHDANSLGLRPAAARRCLLRWIREGQFPDMHARAITSIHLGLDRGDEWILETPGACHRRSCIACSAAVLAVDRAEILRA